MSRLVEEILNKNYELANEELTEQFRVILERKVCEMKKMTAAKLSEMSHEERMKRLASGVLEEEDPHEMRLAPVSADGSASPERLKKLDSMASSKPATASAPTSADKQSAANLEEARINIVKARIRGGVVQRRKRVSSVPGKTIRGGQLKRMSAAERRRRKLGAKKAKLKTRGKQVQIQRNRKLSLMKRKRLGL